ncbi:endonuclease/exonuclease/phosphatase family protein [Actinomadura macrotermitis]|uniref:Sphingomyelinase n=1 Tax=Actinomadura macrotermitis TaxID=2585200 RepID=A0A7K0BVF8_9ACTN|nr:endonuclease/exonuclease/phosphatase family protein [Actinomadura macrotermitis]MQY05161.1 Sphingomyelinase [Actinomadura macrotermitis]
MALCLTTAVTLVPSTASAAPAGTFSAITYNVAGLPEPLSSAPYPRLEAHLAIGARLAPYDVVNVQEDFNYHWALYWTDTHPYRTWSSGPVPFGSGLNTMARHPVTDLKRVTWATCYINQADCLTPKGFTYSRVKLADGVSFDLYNLHADAGDQEGDIKARNAGLAQLTAYIAEHSAGRAVVIMGDTNARYTRPGENLSAFIRDNGLTDSWVALKQGGAEPTPTTPPAGCAPTAPDRCESIDKILYRGSPTLALTPATYATPASEFLRDDGKPLSDHAPTTVAFTWTAR